MSLYADIKFNMKNGYETPILSNEQCGKFRDVVMTIIKEYNAKQGNVEGEMSFLINLTAQEVEEYAKIYTEEAKYDTIKFFIRDEENGWSDMKEVLVCDYYENGEFQINDEDIAGYNCEDAQAFMPLYNRYEEWAYQDIQHDDEVDIAKNLPIFKSYVQSALDGKLFFGIPTSQIESVTLELC